RTVTKPNNRGIFMDIAAIQEAAYNYACPANTFTDKIFLITGAGDGIGKALALALARQGATLILLGRTPEKLEQVYDQIESEGCPQPAMVPMNLAVATAEQFHELAGMLTKEFGRLDGLVHNAALLGDITPIESYAEGTWDTVMQVNVNAAFYLTRALLPMLRQSNDGRILFTSSSVGRKGRAFWGAYAVSKYASEGVMQVVVEELGTTTEIRVHSIIPCGSRNRMLAQAFPGEVPETCKTPAEIVPAYLYFLGPEGAKRTGLALNAQLQRRGASTP